MSIVHPFPLDGPDAFACAQAGCQACQDALMHQHERLAHFILRRRVCSDVPYEDLLQEGRIALWQAILHFNPQRGIAFSIYAGTAIQNQMWRVARRANRPQGRLSAPVQANPLEITEENIWRDEIHTALLKAASRLPERLRDVITAAYGLDGKPPHTLAAIGDHFGVTGEMARYWRNNGLVLLRLPAISGPLRSLCGQDSRAAYLRMQTLSRAWLQKRRSSRQGSGRKQR
jgi:RNA polymerase sigma factor (sigma-70 family)